MPRPQRVADVARWTCEGTMTDDTRTDGDVGHHGDVVNGPEDHGIDWHSVDWAVVEANASRLPGELEDARIEGLGRSDFLRRPLEIEVAAAEARPRVGLERVACLPSPWTLGDIDFSAQPSIDKKLMDELATPPSSTCRQRALHRTAPCRQDLVGRRSRPGLDQWAIGPTTRRRLISRRAVTVPRSRVVWATTMRLFAGPRLLVTHEVGYLPMTAETAAALF
jgi:hypothetical protein